jgi:hypothetical protein
MPNGGRPQFEVIAQYAPWSKDFQDRLPQGSCFDHPRPDIWHPVDRIEMREAKAICESCPIRRQCDQVAETRGEPFGVWGGRYRGLEWKLPESAEFRQHAEIVRPHRSKTPKRARPPLAIRRRSSATV